MSLPEPSDKRAADAARAQLVAAMERLAAGDQSALAEIYTATSAKLFGICHRILNDRTQAEDALQDVYVSLLKSAHRFDADYYRSGRASPISWLATFARNRAIDRLRSGKVVSGAVPVEEANALADQAPLADATLETAQTRAHIHQCIEQLDAPQRDAIRDAFLGGATYAQLAERQDVPLGTMKSWIRRGLAKLKGCLEQ